MQEHVKRMQEEHKELCAKTNALNAFIHGNEVFKTLCDLEQAKMIKQVGFMEAYADVLASRIWTAIRK
jgi:hypothetical protein